MSTKLTKRDIMLLYIMAVVIVVFGFIWLLILPQMNRSSELSFSISELETKKLPMEAAIMGLDSITQNLETAKTDLQAALTDFYPKMENYEIDKTLTGIIIDQYRLHAEGLTISPVPVGVMVPIYSGAVLPVDEGKTPKTDPDSVDMLPLLTSQVGITASGARADLQRFVDDLFLNYPSIRVTEYSITEGETTNLNLTCDFYMQAE